VFIIIIVEISYDTHIVYGFLTADNASPNDVVVKDLVVLNPWFQGEVSQVRCLNHVIKLVMRSLLKPFDGGKLIEVEVESGDDGEDNNWGDNEEGDSDNVEGWIDESDSLSEEEQLELDDTILPVKTAQ
jgi:hypothetical protein